MFIFLAEYHSVRLYKLVIKNMFWPMELIPVLELLLKQFILALRSICERLV